MPWSVADLNTVKLSCGDSLLSNGTISNFTPGAQFSLLARSTMNWNLLIWMSPTGPSKPESGSINATRTVSPAWARVAVAANASAAPASATKMRRIVPVMNSPFASRPREHCRRHASAVSAEHHLRNWESIVAKLLAQLGLQHLAGGAKRNRIDKDDVVRNLPLRHAAFVMRKHLRPRHFGVRPLDHDQQRPLVPLRVRRSDARRHCHRRM